MYVFMPRVCGYSNPVLRVHCTSRLMALVVSWRLEMSRLAEYSQGTSIDKRDLRALIDDAVALTLLRDALGTVKRA